MARSTFAAFLAVILALSLFFSATVNALPSKEPEDVSDAKEPNWMSRLAARQWWAKWRVTVTVTSIRTTTARNCKSTKNNKSTVTTTRVSTTTLKSTVTSTQTQTTASVSTPPPSTIVSTIKETVKETVTLDPIITAVKETVTLLDPTTLPPVTSFFTSTETSTATQPGPVVTSLVTSFITSTETQISATTPPPETILSTLETTTTAISTFVSQSTLTEPSTITTILTSTPPPELVLSTVTFPPVTISQDPITSTFTSISTPPPELVLSTLTEPSTITQISTSTPPPELVLSTVTFPLVTVSLEPSLSTVTSITTPPPELFISTLTVPPETIVSTPPASTLTIFITSTATGETSSTSGTASSSSATSTTSSPTPSETCVFWNFDELPYTPGFNDGVPMPATYAPPNPDALPPLAVNNFFYIAPRLTSFTPATGYINGIVTPENVMFAAGPQASQAASIGQPGGPRFSIPNVNLFSAFNDGNTITMLGLRNGVQVASVVALGSTTNYTNVPLPGFSDIDEWRFTTIASGTAVFPGGAYSGVDAVPVCYPLPLPVVPTSSSTPTSSTPTSSTQTSSTQTGTVIPSGAALACDTVWSFDDLATTGSEAPITSYRPSIEFPPQPFSGIGYITPALASPANGNQIYISSVSGIFPSGTNSVIQIAESGTIGTEGSASTFTIRELTVWGVWRSGVSVSIQAKKNGVQQGSTFTTVLGNAGSASVLALPSASFEDVDQVTIDVSGGTNAFAGGDGPTIGVDLVDLCQKPVSANYPSLC